MRLWLTCLVVEVIVITLSSPDLHDFSVSFCWVVSPVWFPVELLQAVHCGLVCHQALG